MRALLKKILVAFLSIDAVGRFAYWFSTFAWKIKFQRELIERQRSEKPINDLAEKLFEKKVVLHGPFEGMRYPSLRSKSSALYPKLLGTYEQELSPIIEELIAEKYTQVLDIGCAEGYYAVGMALRMPNVNVFAYDIDAEARSLTTEMAKLNGVDKRVQVEKNCDTETLKNFDFSKRSLIICDAEGYEKHLFTKACLENLKTVDLLIETHDFIDIHISSYLEQLFKHSHELQIIQSTGDVIKAKTYKVKELEGKDLDLRYRMLEEGRRYVDEWLLLKVKA